MELIHCNVTPVYKGIQTQRQRGGLLSELGSLVGCGPTPVYKTADGEDVQAPAPCRWWCRVLAVTPHYKTAEPTLEEVDPGVMDPGNGEVAAEPASGDDDQVMQVVIL